jgi:hypothetical protein
MRHTAVVSSSYSSKAACEEVYKRNLCFLSQHLTEWPVDGAPQQSFAL